MRFMSVSLLCLSTLGMSVAAQAQEIYGKAGFLGAGIGYAHGLSPAFTLRGDVTTIGSITHDGSRSDYKYSAKVRNDQATAYLDWFPFESGFRLSAGLGGRDTRVNGEARPGRSGSVKIGDTRVTYGEEDRATGRLKYPTIAPYLGLGWGHNVGQKTTAGWGFVADLGVSFGKPSVDFDVNQSLYAKLDAASGGNADAEIRKQRDDLKDDADKLQFFPHVYVGVSYTF